MLQEIRSLDDGLQVVFSAEDMTAAEEVHDALEELGEVTNASHNSNRYRITLAGEEAEEEAAVKAVREVLGDERQEAPETVLEAQEPCDCDCHRVRHNNGGNYHRRCRVNDKGGVTMSSTRELFASDTKVMCKQCGERYHTPRDKHVHPGDRLEEVHKLLHRGEIPDRIE